MSHVLWLTEFLGSRRYRSLEASYGEAKRQRFLSELAQLEENVHLARSLARDKLDKYSLEQMVGGPPISLGHGEGEFARMQLV